MNFIKFKNLCSLKHITERVKRQATQKGRIEDIQMGEGRGWEVSSASLVNRKKYTLKLQLDAVLYYPDWPILYSDNGKCCLGGGGMGTVRSFWHHNFGNYLGVSTTVEETYIL